MQHSQTKPVERKISSKYKWLVFSNNNALARTSNYYKNYNYGICSAVLDPAVSMEDDVLINTISYICCSLAVTGLLLVTISQTGNRHDVTSQILDSIQAEITQSLLTLVNTKFVIWPESESAKGNMGKLC